MNTKKPLSDYRDEFPITQKFIYLDHAGIAPVPLRVTKAVENYLQESSHCGAFAYPNWQKKIDGVRNACAKLINAQPDEIAFVKNTSHGLSLVAGGIDWKRGDKVILYEKEFPANIYPWLNLKKKGVNINFIHSRHGEIRLEHIESLIDSQTRLLAISSVQFSNGFRIDLEKIGEICKAKGVLLCVDAIQSLGAIPMDVKKCHIDFLAADGHKWLFAPEGIGVFYCRHELAENLNPPLIGWRSICNEFDFDRIAFRLKTSALRFEEGSLNLMGVVALGAALDLLFEVGINRIEQRVLTLGELIIKKADKRGMIIKSPRTKDDRGGIVSITGTFDPAAVQSRLRELGIMVNVRDGALRISPHFYNTEAEIETLFGKLDAVGTSTPRQ